MAFSQALAERLRHHFRRRREVVEKRLFGCLGFMQHGHFVVGIWGDALIVRVGPAAYDDALEEEFVTDFEITGKPLRGWIVVQPEGLDTDEQLSTWIERAEAFVQTLPPKE